MTTASDDEQKRRNDKELEANQGEDQQKVRYPKQVFFIIGNEFCERFSYYGMKAILVLYFKSKLHFNEDDATVIYHTFSLFCYFTPILGALLADGYLGKFKTIVWISILYILGHLLKTLAAITPLGLPPVEFSLIGLALIALGTGGIKPCVAAFGGDQFKLPEQERQLQTFFSVFYFAINIGALASTFITPILRQDVQCFDSEDHTCYALAFGVPALLMLVATLILIAGKPLYNMKPPQGNVLTQVCGGIWHAIKRKFTGLSEKPAHWLDPAKEKYDPSLVEDTKILLRVLVLFLPLPVFWALFDQQGSRWTFQATRMNGQIGSYIIKPDQMQLVNAAFILFLIPLFDGIIYPLFAKVNLLVKPLQRISVGGLLAALAFFISGVVELELQKTYERLPAEGLSNLHLMNTLPAHLTVKLMSGDLSSSNFGVNSSLNHVEYDLKPGTFNLIVQSDASFGLKEKSVSVHLEENQVKGVFVVPLPEQDFAIYVSKIKEEPKKTDSTFPKLRAIFNVGSADNQTLILRGNGSGKSTYLNSSEVQGLVAESGYVSVEPDEYEFFLSNDDGGDETLVGSLELLQGGVSTVVVSTSDGSNPVLKSFALTKENSLHMLWLIPQYFVITVGEIMFSITGLEFSYSKAPATMKSVVQAAWLWTVAFGNLIVIIVAEAKSEALSQASEFFMFGGLMIVDMVLFALLAIRFQRTEAKRKVSGIDNAAAVDAMPMEERKRSTDDD